MEPAPPTARPELRLEVEVESRVQLATQQRGRPLVQRVRVYNDGPGPARGLEIRLRVDPAVAEETRVPLSSIAEGAALTLDAAQIPMPLSVEWLVEQTERVDGTVRVSVEGDARCAPVVCSIELLAWDEWPGAAAPPDTIAAFVTPNHPGTAALMDRVREGLARRGRDPSMEGYQSRSRERVLELVEAIYYSVGAADITYANPPAGFERSGQRVRTVERVLEDRVATCLDITLSLCAVMEQIGLGPLVVIVAGHAYPGVWLTDTVLPSSWIDEPTIIRNRLKLGELQVFDSSAAAQGHPFSRAVATAAASLESDELIAVVDVRAARQAGVRPLPLRRGVAPTPRSAPTPAERGDQHDDDALPPLPRLPGVALAADDESRGGRLRQWKDRLLDLSLNNRLLNQRSRRTRLDLLCIDAVAIAAAFSKGRPLELRWRTASAGDDLAGAAAEALARGEVLIDASEKELGDRATEVFRTVRTFEDDTGTLPLYLTIGALRWVESSASKVQREAPIVLVPLRISRDSVRGPFRLRRSDEDPVVNAALLKKLDMDFAIRVPGVEAVADADGAVDIANTLQLVRRAIRDQPGFEVLEKATVDLFSFEKYLMWADLEQNVELLTESPILQRLLDDSAPAIPQPAPFATPASLDEERAARDDLSVVDADGTQLAAVWSAIDGNSFVLEGPPGTGKSQTITNLIGQLLARGKTVLFVAEKRAALDVVQERLERIGLGPFVLEAHSEKATRSAVISQLEAPLTLARQRSAEGWEAHAGELASLRQTLNAHARRMNVPGPFGESVQQAIGHLVRLASTPRFRLDEALPLDHAAVREARRLARETATRASTVGAPCDSPWLQFDPPAWTPLAQREVETAIDAARIACEATGAALSTAAPMLGVATDADRLDSIVALASLMLDPRPVTLALLRADPSDVERAITDLSTAIDARRAAASVVGEVMDEAVTADPNFDAWRARLARWARSFVLLRFLMLFTTTRQLRRHARAALPPAPVLAERLETAASLRGLDHEIEARAAALAPLFGANVEGAQTDVERLRGAATWARSYRAVRTDLATSREAAERLDALVVDVLPARVAAADARAALERLRDAAAELRAALQVLDALLRPRAPRWLTGSFVERASRLRGLGGLISRFRDWAQYREAARALSAAGAASVVDALERGEITPHGVEAVFDVSLRQRWLDLAMAEDPALAAFSGDSHEAIIERFRRVDNEAKRLAQREIVARLAARVPDPSAPGQIAVLQREVRKRRGHLPVRRLFAEVREVLSRLKPCVLMSPLTVARHLDPSLPPFDVVVFDEASQIPPWDAIGALARGRQAIVVGDSKQLPPTSFFSREINAEDFDDEELVDLESILDHCRAQGMPALLLGWHYRSRHHTLIAFSNHQYYDNRLFLFPSPEHEPRRLGVRWIAVPDGFYDRGKTRQNRAEAAAIVDELRRRLLSPETAHQTLGVVTFSQAQQRCVEDLLDQARRTDNVLDQAITRQTHEPLFVKNLENVQGDQRDVMLFSIGYGPDPGGRVSMAFGPLNRDGGERRLNVAVTRAKELMLVYSTLRAEDIDLTRTGAVGVHHLKAFLEYAQHGPDSLARAVTVRGDAEFESPIEAEVAGALEAAGWRVVPQVGVAGYRIDLGVLDPTDAGRFILAVECDGAMYHSAATARDRDRLRQSVLEGLGWRVFRVWSTDWWLSRERVMRRLVEALEEARDAPTEVGRTSAELAAATPNRDAPADAAGDSTDAVEAGDDAGAQAPSATQTPATAATPWPETARTWLGLPPLAGGLQEVFYETSATSALCRDIAATVAEGAPVSSALLARHVTRAWGFQQTSRRATERVEQLAARTLGVVRDGDAFFPSDVCAAPGRFRFHDEGAPDDRTFADVSVVELAAAVAWVVERAVAIDVAEAQRAVAAIYAVARVGSGVRAQVDAGIEEAERRGWVSRDGALLVEIGHGRPR